MTGNLNKLLFAWAKTASECSFAFLLNSLTLDVEILPIDDWLLVDEPAVGLLFGVETEWIGEIERVGKQHAHKAEMIMLSRCYYIKHC